MELLNDSEVPSVMSEIEIETTLALENASDSEFCIKGEKDDGSSANIFNLSTFKFIV